MPDKRLKARKTPGQVRALETRERLLAAAARVFAEHGYAAGTTNRIAEAAGHSIGSLYQYFPNKDAILLELASAHARAGISAIERRLAEGLPDTLDERIRVFVRAALDNHRDDPALHAVLFEQAPRPPEFVAFLRKAERDAVDTAATLLHADPHVTVANIPIAAFLTVTTIESAVHRFIARSPTAPTDDFEHELTTLLVRYLTAPP